MTHPLDMWETSKPPVWRNYQRIVEGEHRRYEERERLTGANRKPTIRPVQSIKADGNLNAKVAPTALSDLEDLDGPPRCFFDL